MFSVWIIPICVFANLVEAEQALNETAPTTNILPCPQSESCSALGGNCFRRGHAPEGAEVFREGGKKVRCDDKWGCLCFKIKVPAPDCFLPDTEHVGNDLVLPPLEANSSDDCQQICADFPGCKHFTYFPPEDGGCSIPIAKNMTENATLDETGNCYLKNDSNATFNNCSVSGSSSCLPGQHIRSFWQNDWDDILEAICPAGYTISRIRSTHDNGREDRRWRFDCKYSTFHTCQWSGWVNSWDAPLAYVCPYAGVIRGVYSIHDNGREDRLWQYYCCRSSNRCYSDCHYTGLINTWDAWMDYTVPNGWYVAGFDSVHDNGREDREWRVLLCKMKAC